jgi:hypothetical protein
MKAVNDVVRDKFDEWIKPIISLNPSNNDAFKNERRDCRCEHLRKDGAERLEEGVRG